MIIYYIKGDPMKKPVVITLTAALLAAGCSTTKLDSYSRETCPVPPGDAVIEIINNKCMLCHSGDFSSKEEICSRKNLITDAVTSGRMPKIGSLTHDQVQTLASWR